MVGFFTFYADRWLAGTVELSFRERALYIDWIASYAARDGVFPDNIALFREVWRCDLRVAKRVRAALITKGKLYVEDGLVHQVLIKSAVAAAIARSTKSTDAAFKRWENYRKNKATPDADACANADQKSMPTHMPNTNSSKNRPTNGENQQAPPTVENPPATSLATALPPGALASSPPPEPTPDKKPEDLTLQEINARWRGPFT